jgi:hypothetical protein
VTVFNPGPGGGISTPLAFTVTPPAGEPTLTELTPSGLAAGSGAFTLTITGSGFTEASVVQWNGADRPTALGIAGQLTAAIPAGDVEAPGVSEVAVINPPAGGALDFLGLLRDRVGQANGGAAPDGALDGAFAVRLPAGLGPRTVTGLDMFRGGGGRWDTVSDSIFWVLGAAPSLDGALVNDPTGAVNFPVADHGGFVIFGSDLAPTLFEPGTFLALTVKFEDGSTAFVTTSIPAVLVPPVGLSNALAFTVGSANPVPVLDQLAPSSATAGAAAFTLTVNGSGFIPTSVVRWNGADRPTTFASSTVLTAAIPASDVAAAGAPAVTVFNPGPGGGLSGEGTFTIAPASGGLVATQVSDPPATALVGGTFVATDTVLNTGATRSARSRTRFYFSLDPVRDAGDRRPGAFRAVPRIQPGDTSTGDTTITVPKMPLGTYFLIACADDVNIPIGANTNCVTSATTVQIVAPDLVMSRVANPPAAGTPGSAFTLNTTVKNKGTAPAGATMLRFYLSPTTQKAAGTLLSATRDIGPLDPDQTSPGPTTLTIPAGTATGAYFVIGCADDLGVVTEFRENNNCKASAATIQVGP